MKSPLRPATDLLKQYAEYHRDPRNIATHFIGVPMIVFAVGVLLARAGIEIGGVGLTAAWLLFGLAAAWYLTRGQLALGAATTLGVGVLIALSHTVAGGSVVHWLGWGLGFFAVGWTLQFIGHYYEGRKPAFADDLIGLLVGPMFVMFEALAALGLFRALSAEIEGHAGPTRLRDLAQPLNAR
ncbi:MAG: DUF962 domain-containing protein [Pseudomonadota bacterium]|nr:DUF962 domain-containing protein [Pseudomonadota bacterium]